ncbi:S-layer homology domain-containing protein [Thermosyntropha lipolytica DSM 11003]|uniref:S-layer homology domain-containing protein n=1 Tax=Thermosyntropha lipolytica DSM 11003 TaxID=1123382 RepID=A0A1M5JF50_9FIRM|nr:S-layer homology domain-containing protein [Thermosyntropha lipolytica]SHG39194.1 S-layer homology domain-containing protein [Thermosyntropha lipolytica DSM 11003]
MRLLPFSSSKTKLLLTFILILALLISTSSFPAYGNEPDKKIGVLLIAHGSNQESWNNKDPIFQDTEGHWAQDHIKKAYSIGLIAGYDNNKFAPDSPITREQAAVIIARMNEITGKYSTSGSNKNLNFADTHLISAWARKGVQKCIDMNIMHGYPDNRFYPDQKLKRSEACVIFSQML